MADAKIEVAHNDLSAHIRLIGRTTFACSQHLRDYGMLIVEKRIAHIRIDLSACEGMDSTIMGVLAMIGLRAKKYQLQAEIVNAAERHKKLLFGLGLKNLFTYTHTPSGQADWLALCQTRLDPPATLKVPLATERTVLEAHEVLMSIDPENVPKFKDVVDYLRQDMKRLEGQG